MRTSIKVVTSALIVILIIFLLISLVWVFGLIDFKSNKIKGTIPKIILGQPGKSTSETSNSLLLNDDKNFSIFAHHRNGDGGGDNGEDEDECKINSDCGSLESKLTCIENAVYNKTTLPVCNDNECDEDNSQVFVVHCEFGCSQGACLPKPPVCSVDSNCGNATEELVCRNDGNVYNRITNPFCTNNSCFFDVSYQLENECEFGCNETSAECLTKPECGCDEDCPKDEIEFSCEDNNLIKIITNYFCSDGTCDSEIEKIFVENCDYGCSSGECLSECVYDFNCGNSESELICVGNNVTNRTISPMCLAGSCSSLTNDETVETCLDTCFNGACVETSCNENLDCGQDRWVGGTFCENGDVYSYFKVFTCLNPGTSQSSCTDQVDYLKKQDCNYGCNNGECLPKPECNAKFKVVFNKIENVGKNANMQPKVYTSTNNYENDSWIDLIDNGEFVIDNGITKNVPGLAVQRGPGWIYFSIYGYHSYNAEKTWATIVLDNAQVSGFQNEIGVKGFEYQGDKKYGGQNDEVFWQSDGTEVPFYSLVGDAEDSFWLYYELDC